MPSPQQPPIRLLVPQSMAARISRRGFLGGLAGAAALPLLAACGSGEESSTAPTTGSSGGSGSVEGELSIYTWGSYDNPKTFKDFTKKLGAKVSLSSYDSNEEMIAKLVSAKGTSGYDLVVPTGPYIPQMVANDLLMELDHAKLPNLKHVDKSYLGRDWDPENKHSVCKDWGTTGFVYDTTKIKRKLTSWKDFLDAATNEASGETSVLNDPAELAGIYFWSRNEDWTTTDEAKLKACQDYLVKQLAPHIKKFEAYPGSGGAMAKHRYMLMQAWNGDARQGFLSLDDPSRYEWVLPTPETELWMDNWAIVSGAKHPNAAHAFINFVLDPANSFREITFIGYNTGVTGTEERAKKEGLKYMDMIYFTDDEVARMKTGAVNEATQRHVDIMNRVKAAAAG